MFIKVLHVMQNVVINTTLQFFSLRDGRHRDDKRDCNAGPHFHQSVGVRQASLGVTSLLPGLTPSRAWV